MDKKKLKSMDPEGIKGFEEFIEGQPNESTFLPRPSGSGTKKEVSFEHFTFLTNDSERLTNLKGLLSMKIPFSRRFEQGKKLIEEELEEVAYLRKSLFDIQNEKGSPFRKSMGEIFTGFFGSGKP